MKNGSRRTWPSRQHQNAETANAVSAIDATRTGGSERCSARRRLKAEPERIAIAGSAATWGTHAGLQDPGQPLSHEDTKSTKVTKVFDYKTFVRFVLFGVFVRTCVEYAVFAAAKLSPLQFLRSNPAARGRPAPAAAARGSPAPPPPRPSAW